MSDLDAILVECCKVCGIYRCENHPDWVKCQVADCISTWNPRIFLGCPLCAKRENGKADYRPLPKEACSLCYLPLEDGEIAYTDSTPSGTFCYCCAVFHHITYWTIRVRTGRLWTIEEIAAERKRAV